MSIHVSNRPSNEFLSLVWKVFFSEKGRGLSIEQHFPFIFSSSKNLFFEVYNNSTFVGGLAVAFDNCDGKEVAKIGLICIDSSFRGQGHFKKLLCFTLTELNTRAIDSIVLWTKQHELYFPFGFVISDPYLFGRVVAPCRLEDELQYTVEQENIVPVPTFSTFCVVHTYGKSKVYTSDFSNQITILGWDGDVLEVELIIRAISKGGCLINICYNDPLIHVFKAKGYQIELNRSNLQMQLKTKLSPDLNINVLDRI